MKIKDNLVLEEIPKYKKKSNAKGQPRANHKHKYETVLLSYHYKYGAKDTVIKQPTKVCPICGRINYVDNNPEYYIKTKIEDLPVNAYKTELSAKALQLDRWYAAEGILTKFAIKEKINNE